MAARKFEFNQLITFLKVNDLQRSRYFYAEILGLPEIYERQGKVVILQLTAESFIGLVPGDLPSGAERTAAISLIVADADAWWPRLEAKGVPTRGKPIFKSEFGIYVLYVTDPDGNTVEFLEMRAAQWPHSKIAGRE